VANRDITEGRGSPTANIGRSIAVDLGITSSSSVWTNTDIAYDVAVVVCPSSMQYQMNAHTLGKQPPLINLSQITTKSQVSNHLLAGGCVLNHLFIVAQV